MTRRETHILPGGVTVDDPMECALQWFALLQDGSATEDEHAAFEAWIGASPANGKAYAQVANLWGAPEFSAVLSGAPRPTLIAGQPNSYAAIARHPTRRRLVGMCLSAIAAVVLVGVFLGVDLLELFGPKADYRTGVGEMREVALSDGSTVTLNTDSAVRVEIGAGERHIDLLDGEVFFEVVRDEARPFVVTTGGTTVRVLGTAFTVYRDERRIAVAVKNGRVSVSSAGAEAGGLVLTPGQRAVVSPDGTSRVWRDGGDSAFAWLDGRMIFRDARLEDVLAQLDRYYVGWIYTVGAIDAVRVSGNFRIDDPDAVVRALARTAGARVIHLPGDVLIIR